MRLRRSAPARAEARDGGMTLEVADGAVDHAPRASWSNRRGLSRYLAACVAATRPKSLTAAVIPFAVGTSLASAEGPLRWPHAVPAFLAFVLMQIGCNLVNDACDFLRGADGPNRTGPTRVSQAGVFRPGTVHLVGVACLVASMLCMMPAMLDLEYISSGFGGDEQTASIWGFQNVLQTNYRLRDNDSSFKEQRHDVQWCVVFLAALSVSAAYFYTGGPFPLGYHGLGDVTVVAFFGVVAVSLARRTHLGRYGYQLTSGDTLYHHDVVISDLKRTLLNPDVVVAGIQTGSLACVLLAVNNARDLFTDTAANKKTLAVKYGLKFVKAEIDLLLSVAFALTWYWWFTRVGNVGNAATETNTSNTSNWSYSSTLPCLTLPTALSVSRRAKKLTPGHRDCDGVLALAALLHFAFGGLLALGIWLDAIA